MDTLFFWATSKFANSVDFFEQMNPSMGFLGLSTRFLLGLRMLVLTTYFSKSEQKP